MAGRSRTRDDPIGFSLHSTDSDSSSPAAPWANSIWNKKPLRIGLGSATRDNSQSRDSKTYMSATSDLTKGKTGSGSLVPSSDTEWRPSRSSWGDNSTANMSHVRSSGVSPARKRSVAQAQPLQHYTESSTTSFFSAPRSSQMGQTSSKPLLDPTSTNFTSSRQMDSLNSGFAGFRFGQADAHQQRSDSAANPWPDATPIRSPSDGRGSTAGSEYFGPSSGTPSRNGSLPPSRHGVEPPHYTSQIDTFSRPTQLGARQTSSFSHPNGRPFQERSGSIQSDFGRFTLAQGQGARVTTHRSSLSTNDPPPGFEGAEEHHEVPREHYATTQLSMGIEATGHKSAGTYTPDSYINGQASDPNIYFRPFQLDSRSAPNGTGARQSPFFSHINTPPVYDHLNPAYLTEQTLAHPNNLALVQNKLAGYQVQQEGLNFIPPNQFHQQQFQQIMSANHMRNPYAYQFAVQNGMPMTALPPHMTMAPGPPLMALTAPLRGPREHQFGDGVGTMSALLARFKSESKQNKRWELMDIYTNVVEFAGDQHGSRFIQQKLETANSDVKDHVFKELEANALPLMQDVFGNYVIQKFFEHGDQTQKKILAGKMKGHVLALANQMYACRVVQKALEHVLVDQQAAIVKELEKDVLKTVKDQNGNHVIQKAIDRVPHEHIQNVIKAFRGNIGVLSMNAYGCRVVQRLLEKVPEPQRRFIMTELHVEGPKLITDNYGNYVVQHVIEHGLEEDRAKLVSLIKAQFLMFSKHKFASNVVERCLVCGSDGQRAELVSTVTAKNGRGESNILNLLKDGFGNYVIQKLLETLSRNDYDRFVVALKPELEKAKNMISGKQIISVEKKMYRYDRIDSPTMPREPTDVPPTPPLSSSAQSPQTSSLPSTNVSTVDGPINMSLSDRKDDFIVLTSCSTEENAS
ncbi:ARM repeat-containing protein [Dothidotthia symphoricarpi CBS 119687]|uniref:ARM repeat-containing protein n=1 Tax=Dothidotthia symphoricarpi CBS 119687 TaxID=1392245 RepID=A0A6A6AD98_9PLEO|nr:ARM repeat-containing protein [Dothidotthia symphoricarpi CBS 119687]KAF2128721.1 ARM repeat-containing protein [Dothidotthia symphoricarpi CBS 119687]